MKCETRSGLRGRNVFEAILLKRRRVSVDMGAVRGYAGVTHGIQIRRDHGKSREARFD